MSLRVAVLPFLFLFILILQIESKNEVANLTVTLSSDTFAAHEDVSCSYGVKLQLWFNKTVYETNRVYFTTPASSVTFSITNQNLNQLFNRGSNDCLDPGPKLIINNPNPPSCTILGGLVDVTIPDAIILTAMQFGLQDGTIYGADSICIDQQEYTISDPDTSFIGDYGPKFNDYAANDTLCGSQSKHYHQFCVDSEVDIDCGPVTQIIHFDESRPNEIIHNARWESGLNFNMDINVSSITCAPTMSPTTAIPSSSPTHNPTQLPISNSPTFNPTISPSAGNTLYI